MVTDRRSASIDIMDATARRNRVAALAVALASLALVCLDAAPVQAQWGDAYDSPSQGGYEAPRRRARGSEDGYGRPQARRYAPQPQEQQRQFFWPWEDRPQQAQPQPQYAPRAPRQARPQRQRTPASNAYADALARKRKLAQPPATAKPTPDVPGAPTEVTPIVQIAVFGDSLASYLGKGLDESFADNDAVEIVDKSRGDSGVVRKDVVDWAKAADDYLKANPKTAYALMMVGVNDRQAIRENGESYEPLSDKWREIYAARIDAIVKVFVEHKVPLIWVDTPPVRFENLTRDLASINDIVKERVQKAGQTYVDIWPGFVDDKNRFITVGPDLEGQRAVLRTSDGIHFTNAGARKVAHFADVELKRMMAANGTLAPVQPPEIAALPGTPTPEGAPPAADDTAAIDRRITAMLPSLPEPPGIPTMPVKPVAGPVVPLGRAETSPGGALISGRPREGDPLGTVERALQRGVAPTTQPGRADDFRWPPG